MGRKRALSAGIFRRWPILLGVVALALGGCGKGGPPKGGASSSGSRKAASTPTIDAGALNAMVGKKAPAWELKDHTGKLWKLSEHKGNVVALMTWATW